MPHFPPSWTTMAAASSNLRLKDFFPKVTKECRPVATPFFECFGIKSKQPEEGVSRLTQALRIQTSQPIIVVCCLCHTFFGALRRRAAP